MTVLNLHLGSESEEVEYGLKPFEPTQFVVCKCPAPTSEAAGHTTRPGKTDS